MQTQQLSTIMRLSWKIQHLQKHNRSKSLVAAWVIFQQADIMVYYLIKKHTPTQSPAEPSTTNLTLFSNL